MKKNRIFLFIVCCSLCLFGCSKNEIEEGTIIFSDVFSYEKQEQVIEIIYHDFNGDIVVIDDPKRISSAFEILNNSKYKEYVGEGLEGIYFFEFISEDNVISFGISGDYIAIMGNRMIADKYLSSSFLAALGI